VCKTGPGVAQRDGEFRGFEGGRGAREWLERGSHEAERRRGCRAAQIVLPQVARFSSLSPRGALTPVWEAELNFTTGLAQIACVSLPGFACSAQTGRPHKSPRGSDVPTQPTSPTYVISRRRSANKPPTPDNRGQIPRNRPASLCGDLILLRSETFHHFRVSVVYSKDKDAGMSIPLVKFN
jgi:hypothetical protein